MHRRGIRRGGLGLRAAALLGAGSLAVHELRYLVGCGGEASRMLGAQGHSYLALATTLAVLAFLVALAAFLAHVARGGENRAPAVRTRRLAPAASAALFAIYSVQELVEGLVATGHPGGLGGVYGNGGWTAALFAAALGLVVALLLRGADAVLRRVARRRRPSRPRRALRVRVPSTFRVALVRRLGLSRNIAGRAPPPSFT